MGTLSSFADITGPDLLGGQAHHLALVRREQQHGVSQQGATAALVGVAQLVFDAGMIEGKGRGVFQCQQEGMVSGMGGGDGKAGVGNGLGTDIWAANETVCAFHISR